MKRENWPFFGTIVFSDPYFKLGSRTPYIDAPSGFIGNFLSEIQEITKKYKANQEKLYDEAIKLKNRYNEYFEKNYGDWLRLRVTSLRFGEKPFGIQVRIKWNKFYSFLEDFAKRDDISLEEKYLYLTSCRYSAIPIMNRQPLEKVLDKKRLERVQDSVREICKKDIGGIRSKIRDLLAQLERVKIGLFNISKRKSVTIELATLEYFPEMVSTLQGIDILAQNGLLTSCYREMRKILENLYWVVSNDILLLKLLKNAERIEGNDIIFIPTYREISKAWHEWARNNNATLSHIKELKEKIQPFAEFIRLYGRMKEYNWGKEKITDTLIDNLSYSSFLLFTGIEELEDEEDEIDFIPSYETKTLQMLAEEDLKNTIWQLKGGSLSKSDEKLVKESLKMEIGRLGKSIVPLYPSNEFVIQFVSKSLHLGDIYTRYYERYSYFVHSYDTSWQIFPFSSVLEFKILEYELSAFCDMIVGIFDKFFKRLNYRGKYSHKI
jgi:hypothetical protein